MQSYKSRVLFKGACSAIPEDALLLEVGPHAIMRAPLRQNCAALPYVNVMKKGEDATLSLREAVAGLWRKGAALKWEVPEHVPGQHRSACPLPTPCCPSVYSAVVCIPLGSGARVRHSCGRCLSMCQVSPLLTCTISFSLYWLCR